MNGISFRETLWHLLGINLLPDALPETVDWRIILWKHSYTISTSDMRTVANLITAISIEKLSRTKRD